MRFKFLIFFITVLIYSTVVKSESFEDDSVTNICSSENICKNLGNAIDCQATRYCLENAWGKEGLSRDTRADCASCKDMILQARSQLPVNKDLLEGMLDDSCKQLPSSYLQMSCSAQTKAESLTELMILLNSQMGDEEICNVMELCTISAKHIIEPNQMSCSTCNMFSQFLQSKFESMDRNDVLHQLLESCYNLGNLAEVCNNIVIDYFDEMYELAKNQLESNGICQTMGICSAEEAVTQLSLPEKKIDEFYCHECEKIVDHLKKSIVGDGSEAKFKEKLQGYCKKTGKFQSQCLLLVDEYHLVVYRMLKSNMNLCLLIGVCHKPKVTQEVHEVELPDIETELEDPQSPQCLACKTAFRIAKKLISKRASNDKVKNAMDRACNKLGKLSHKCHEFIRKHGDGVIRFARNPRVLCSMIGMCFPIGDSDAPSSVYVENDTEILVTTDVEYKDSKNCVLCKNVIKALKDLDTTRSDVKAALNHICHQLQDQEMQQKCQSMLQSQSVLIIDALAKNLPHQQICRMLNMCLLYKDNELPQLSTDEIDVEAKTLTKCKVCRTVAYFLRRMTKGSTDRDTIKKAVENICQKLSENVRPGCEELVRSHGGQIVELMVKQVPYREICKSIGMCRIPTDEFSEDVEQVENSVDFTTDEEDEVEVEGKGKVKVPKCFVCKSAIKALKLMIRHVNKDEIKNALSHVCHKLGKLKNACDRMIAQNGGRIVDLMAQHTPPNAICKAIGMCRKRDQFEDFLEIAIENFELTNPSELLDFLSANSEDQQSTAVEKDKKEDVHKCNICQIAVSEVKDRARNENRAELKKVLDHICQGFKPKYRGICDKMVKDHSSQILDLIIKHMHTKQLCQTIGMCPKPHHIEDFWQIPSDYIEETKSLEIDILTPIEIDEETTSKGPRKCSICKHVVRELHRMAKSGDKEELKKALGQVCQKFPTKWVETCNKMVQEHSTKIVDMMAQHATGKELCRAIGMCNRRTSDEDSQSSNDISTLTYTDLMQVYADIEPKEGPICLVCKIIADKFRSLIDTDNKRNLILHTASSFCHLLPSFLGNACEGVVKGFGAAILHLLSKITTNQYCRIFCIFTDNLTMEDTLYIEDIFDKISNHIQEAYIM